MVKLEFPGELAKTEGDLFCNALINAAKEKAPLVFEVLKREGLCTFLDHVCAVVYPKNCTNIDVYFFSFSFWGRKNCVLWLPGKLKNTERKSFVSNFQDTIIYTPKGSETDRFFRASSFPKEVRNGYPKIGGKTIVPDEKLYIWMDDGRENKDEQLEKTKNKTPHSPTDSNKSTKVRLGIIKNKAKHNDNESTKKSFSGLLPAVLGMVIAIIFLVLMLKTLN